MPEDSFKFSALWAKQFELRHIVMYKISVPFIFNKFMESKIRKIQQITFFLYFYKQFTQTSREVKYFYLKLKNTIFMKTGGLAL